MYRVERPPCAVIPDMHPNAIATDLGDPTTYGVPILSKPDPMPLLDPALGVHNPSDAAQKASWLAGDLRPVASSLSLAWFRIYRERATDLYPGGVPADLRSGVPGATFIITVGSGGTQGYADWAEVTAASAGAEFGNDPGVFASQLAGELRQWFRVEWSGAIGGGEQRLRAALDGGRGTLGNQEDTVWNGTAWVPGTARRSWHARNPINASRSRDWPYGKATTLVASHEPRNYIGTITYIERLVNPPLAW
jgi:hypothetical protein